MKVLIVCSGNVHNFNFKIHQSFIYEQIETIKTDYNIDYDIFLIKGKGLKGYLRNLNKLKQKITSYFPDIIHAHYGLSGMLANLQFKVPVITTFHGTDCLNLLNKLVSTIVHLRSMYSIFVTAKLYNNLFFRIKKKSSFIKCGINTQDFKPLEDFKLLNKSLLNNNKIKILFASAFDNTIKNFSLAQKAISYLSDKIDLTELKNITREEVNILLNSVDLLLLTSLSEGSPQVIKEAMACNCPIVATDVGDIKEIISETEGCYLTTFEPKDVADKIKMAIDFSKTKGRTNGREKIMKYDNKIIANKVYGVYQKVING